jgi:[ribosomal protein S5]-alanine N-acetyltransferase
MKEDLKAAINNGFSRMELNRIHAYVAIENTDSGKLPESFGFVNEGIYRDKHLFRGRYYDHYCFSLLKREWELINIYYSVLTNFSRKYNIRSPAN